ncbi:hypothetical protein [Streptomyces sp. cg2]|uniref:hypothetical protein n=1 Tax=Streptomyces sp. cg2 TaxID=3238799 RepID=UPI0034E27B87
MGLFSKKNQPEPEEPKQPEERYEVDNILDLTRDPMVEHITWSDGTKETRRAQH